MKISNTIKNILIAVAVIIVLCFLYQLTKDWLKPTLIKALGGYTEKQEKTTVDTLAAKYKDIYVKYEKLKTEALITKPPVYIPRYIYTKEPQTNKPSFTGKSLPSTPEIGAVLHYETVINDTILTGTIETIIALDSCKILSQSLNYTPKIPYIREKIVEVVKHTETTLGDKPKAYIGAGLDINFNNQITPQALYLTKKKWLYKAGYTKSLDNQFPNTVTIGIAKLF